jgi:branched-chain amino acid transport system ATP-binding protein
MTAPLLQLEDLTVRYGGVTALRSLNLVVRQGELVTLLGSNGAGKSTTLRAISQLVPATAGTLRWNGGVINGLRTERTVKLGIAHCPEGRRVLARQSVADNLELGAWLRRDRNAIRQDLDRNGAPRRRAPSRGVNSRCWRSRGR